MHRRPGARPELEADADHPSCVLRTGGRLWPRSTRPSSARCWKPPSPDGQAPRCNFTDRGIEEPASRRGDDEVTFGWLAEQLRTFVDLHPSSRLVERLATWLARLDDEVDELNG